MRWAGYERRLVSKLSLPGDIAQRMKAPHVVALAGSTDELGGEPMHAPSINDDVSPPELVAGRDRMAATILRGRKHVWVHVGKDWSPTDLLKAEIHENLHRRHDDKAALTRALVDKAEVLVGQVSDNSDAESEQGRPKTNRTRAREIVAEASGDTVEAVRKLDERAKAREGGAAGEPSAAKVSEPAAPLIESFGNDIPGHITPGLGIIVGAFDKADKLLRQAQAAIGELGLTNYSPGVIERMKTAIHDAAALVRHERPTHLCPKCRGKSHPITGPRCGLCQERGIVTATQYGAAPGEQRAPVRSTAGLPYKRQGRVVIVDEQGAEHEVTE